MPGFLLLAPLLDLERDRVCCRSEAGFTRPAAAVATSAVLEAPVAGAINTVMLAGQTAHLPMLLLGQHLATTQRGLLSGRGLNVGASCMRSLACTCT